MIPRLLPRLPWTMDVRLVMRRSIVRPVRRRVRPDLVVLEDRVVPGAYTIPFDSVIDASVGPTQTVRYVGSPNRIALGKLDTGVSHGVDSADELHLVSEPIEMRDSIPITGPDGASDKEIGKRVTRDESQPVAGAADDTPPRAEGKGVQPSDRKPGVGDSGNNISRPRKLRQNDDGGFFTVMGGGQGGGRGSSGFSGVPGQSSQAPGQPAPVPAGMNADFVSVVVSGVRSAPATVTPPVTIAPITIATPAAVNVPTIAPTAVTSQLGAPVSTVLLGPDAVPATNPVATMSAVPVQAPTFTPTPTGVGTVLANFASTTLNLPRAGGEASSQRDVTMPSAEPNDGSTTPAQSMPAPAARSGAGVLTQEVPEVRVPPTEVVPAVSDQSAPVAPIENGVSGTTVFVATVAAVGLLAGAYYSQFRRTGRGPRLRVR